jgi:hypothetical protein
VNQWWKDNWDKVLTALVSVVLSGVVGFFSAVISIRSEMSDLKERIVKIETQITSTLNPKSKITDDNFKSIVDIQHDLRDFKTQTDISISTNKLLDLRMEQVRVETIQTLKSALDEARKQSAATK